MRIPDSFRKLPLLAAALLVPWAAPAGDVKHHEEEYLGRPVHTLDNGIARISVTPQIGARVLRYDLQDEALGSLLVHRHNIDLQPTDQWSGAEYGGLSDMATQGWPGELWGVDFDAALEGDNTVVLQTEHNGIHHQRSVELLPDSSVLRFQTSQTNQTDSPRELVPRIHGEFSVGLAADDNDRIQWVEGGEHHEIAYRLGWENPRMHWIVPREWVACVDTHQQLALLRFFQPVTDDKLLVWHGHNEGVGPRDEKGGFYGLDRFLEKKNTSKNDSVQATEEFALIRDLPRVDFALREGYRAGALLPDQVAYGPGQTATLEVRIGGGVAGPAHQAKLFLETQGTETREIGSIEIPPYDAAQSAGATLETPIENNSLVRVQLLDEQGETLAEFSRSLSVDAEAHATALQAIEELDSAANALRKAVATQALEEHNNGKSQLSLADWYLQQAHDAFDRGHFDQASDLAEEYVRQLQTATARTRQIQPDSQQRSQFLELTEDLR